MQGFL